MQAASRVLGVPPSPDSSRLTLHHVYRFLIRTLLNLKPTLVAQFEVASNLVRSGALVLSLHHHHHYYSPVVGGKVMIIEGRGTRTIGDLRIPTVTALKYFNDALVVTHHN